MEQALAIELLDVAVSGGTLRVARLGRGERSALALHGITSSHLQFVPLARHLGSGLSLLAPDLRGRGASNHLPGPYGMEAHAEDCARVLAELAAGPVPVLGHSMGAYVAVVLAARHPELVSRLVLADGGIPVPLPDDVDPDVVMKAVLGPALARLDMVFASPEDYRRFWREHPAIGPSWDPDVEAYVDYDLEETDGGFRSRARPEAVWADGQEHIVDPSLVTDALDSVRCPVVLLRAPRNLIDQPPPLLPEEVVAPWRARLPAFSDVLVDDTNHYSLMLGDRGPSMLAAALVAQ